MSSMEVNVDMLEQMDLMDISDQEALDVFLNSGGEDNTLLSPVSGRGEKPAWTSSLSPARFPSGSVRHRVLSGPTVPHTIWPHRRGQMTPWRLES